MPKKTLVFLIKRSRPKKMQKAAPTVHASWFFLCDLTR